MKPRKSLAVLGCGLAFVMSAAQAQQKQIQAAQPVAPANMIKAPAPVTKLPPVEVAKPAVTRPQVVNPAAAVGKPALDPALAGTKTAVRPVAVTPVANPLGDKKFGAGAGSSLDQFSREADMAKITGRSASLLNEAAGKKGPGGTVTQPIGNRITHDFDAGRGTAISKQAQQSSGGGVPIPYPNATDSGWRPGPVPTTGGAEPPARGISSGDEAGALKGTVSTTPKEPKPDSARSRPAPDSEGGDGGGRVFGEAKEKPSAADIAKTRKRQVGMPSEGGREFEEIKGDEKLAASTMAKRTGNAIRPAGEDAGQAGLTPGSTNPGNRPAGNPEGAGNRPAGPPQHGSGCPADSPTC